MVGVDEIGEVVGPIWTMTEYVSRASSIFGPAKQTLRAAALGANLSAMTAALRLVDGRASWSQEPWSDEFVQVASLRFDWVDSRAQPQPYPDRTTRREAP
jgi:hypothetical protein